MLQNSESIVLRCTNYSETSLIFRAFTKEYGKRSFIAKGARREKSPFAHIIVPGNVLQLHYYHKEERELSTVKSADLQQSISLLRDNYAAIIFAMFMLECADRGVEENHAQPDLHRLLVKSLLLFAQGEGQALILFFLHHFSALLGYRLQLQACANCGGELNSAKLNLSDGRIFCPDCLPTNERLRLQRSNISFLQKLVQKPIAELTPFDKEAKSQKVLFQFLLQYLALHSDALGRLKSASMAEALFDGKC